jgi:hypothetical protein
MPDPEKCTYCGEKPEEQCDQCGGCQKCCQSEYHSAHCGHPDTVCNCPETDFVDREGNPP